MRPILRPEAEFDLVHAYRWYEDQRSGLGREFLEEISRCLDAIGNRPLSFGLIDPILRRATTRRFPYALYFIAGEASPVVVAAFHMARSPARLSLRRSPPPA